MTADRQPVDLRALRYTIEKDENCETECLGADRSGWCPAHNDSPGHTRFETRWTIWDTEREEHATGEPFQFATRREAKTWLDAHLAALREPPREGSAG